MAAAQCIESSFFKQTHPAQFVFFPCCRPQQSGIMMDTSAAQFQLLSIQPQSMHRVKGQGTNTKGCFCRIQTVFSF